MNLRDKILFFAFPISIIVIIVFTVVGPMICDQIIDSTRKKLEYINDPNTISSIIIKKQNKDYFDYHSKMKDSLFIDDYELIEKIRYCLLNIKDENYQHPGIQWEYIMNINLKNGEVMSVVVNKMDNGNHLTAFIDLYDGCESRFFNYSDSLLSILNIVMIKNK